MNDPHASDASQRSDGFDPLELELRRLKPRTDAFEVRENQFRELYGPSGASNAFGLSLSRRRMRAALVVIVAAAACLVIAIVRLRIAAPLPGAHETAVKVSAATSVDGLNDAEMSIAAYMKVAAVSPDALERMLESQAIHLRPASESKPLSATQTGI